MIDERLVYEVLSVVEEIPFGKVATYGQIARLIGREKNARLIGKILSVAQQYGQYHCHKERAVLVQDLPLEPETLSAAAVCPN